MDIALAKQNNERIVKSYFCTRWANPKLEGYLTLTTERVVFAGVAISKTTGKPTDRIVEEAELKSISGLSSFYGTKINWLAIILGALLSLGGMLSSIAAVGELSNSYLPTSVAVGMGLILIALICVVILGLVIILKWGFGRAFFLNIYSSQSAGTPIAIGNADRANHVLLSLCGQPTEQTDEMMLELGALITDLKTDKEEAFKAWGPKA